MSYDDFKDVTPDEQAAESMLLAQDSIYWHFFKIRKRYNLTIHLFEGALQMPPTSVLSGGIDPYVVVSVVGRREATKRKTQVVRRTTRPVFNTAMHFKNVKVTDQIRIELKVNRNLAENILLFQTFLSVDEVLNLVAPHPLETQFEIILQDARADERDFRDATNAPSAALLCYFDIDPRIPPEVPAPDVAVDVSASRPRIPGIGNLAKSHSKRLSVGSVDTDYSDDADDEANQPDLAFLTVNKDFACLMLDSNLAITNESSTSRPSTNRRRSGELAEPRKFVN